MEIKRSVPSRPAKDRQSILPARCGLTRCSTRPLRACGQCQRHLRARGPYGMAHPSAGQNLIVTAGRGRVQRWGGPVEESGRVT